MTTPEAATRAEVRNVGSIRLSNGAELSHVEVAYEQYGRLSPSGDNAILVCHALTGSARAAGEQGWWDPLIGPGRALDTERYAVICVNLLGSCYGSTGPLSVNPATGRPWAGQFPSVSISDMVAVQRRLLDSLGVRSLELVAGGSLGGLQVLEWAAQAPEFVRRIAPIACGLSHSPWCIAFNECSREAIRLDPDFHDGDYAAHGSFPSRGLSLARMVAMTSYRSAESFEVRFARKASGAAPGTASDYEVASYLYYQGRKLVDRFDANAYLRITDAMDRFDVGEGRGGPGAALAEFRGPALVVGIDSDVLYPLPEQERMTNVLADNGNPVQFEVLHSIHGHDAFLMEWDQLADMLRGFLDAS